MTIQDRLIGAWRLAEWKVSRGGAQQDPPWGPAGVCDGLLIYSPDGHVSATLSTRGRPKFASESIDGATDAEKCRAYDTFLSYSGKFEIDEENSTVHHHVELSSFPNFIGQDLVRIYEFDGSDLVLRIPEVKFKDMVVGGYIRWTRLRGEGAR